MVGCAAADVAVAEGEEVGAVGEVGEAGAVDVGSDGGELLDRASRITSARHEHGVWMAAAAAAAKGQWSCSSKQAGRRACRTTAVVLQLVAGLRTTSAGTALSCWTRGVEQ